MTKADQLASAGVELQGTWLYGARNKPAKPAQLRQKKINSHAAHSKLAQESLELGLYLHSRTVVEPPAASIAFQLLEGTGLLAPQQATPAAGRLPDGPDVPVTAERRGEGARV
ncbi:hypothetical protein JK359_36500 [Streptomyces actinomycinicus]|uniref:Uncharacterized protein n=1 Tax=Streptomyces actinomycinicus TaxID=1695166 RepID=A0A937ESJ1_9ACTN|nr:hypothetical protein [Streptomyces actinomycinicus]MBL1087391.1 hypothetical protein [Streptomyces actinomycinicus]